MNQANFSPVITRSKLVMAGVRTPARVNGQMRKQAKPLLHKKSRKAASMPTQRVQLLLQAARLTPNKSPSQKTTASLMPII